MHIPTFVFIFILFLKNILLLLLFPKHVIKLLGYNLGCYICPRFDLVNSSIARGIDSRKSITIRCS